MRLGKGGGGLLQPACIFRSYFLLKEFSPLSWSLEQAKLTWEVKNVKLKMKMGREGLNFLELSSVTGFSLRIPLSSTAAERCNITGEYFVRGSMSE